MLPPNVLTVIQSHGHTGHQQAMRTARANASSANNIMRHSAARQIDEMGPAAAASVAKILALP